MVTFIIGKIEGIGKQAKRFAVGALLNPAFDIPDRPDAERRPLGQFLLRQARRDAVPQQEITDGLGMQGARFPMGAPLPFSHIDRLRCVIHAPHPSVALRSAPLMANVSSDTGADTLIIQESACSCRSRQNVPTKMPEKVPVARGDCASGAIRWSCDT